MIKLGLVLILFLLQLQSVIGYSHGDTLRGSNGRGRAWWKVVRYDLTVDFDIKSKRITGCNIIDLKVTDQPTDTMQIDLQAPMIVDSVCCSDGNLRFKNEDKVWWITGAFATWRGETTHELKVYFHGVPRIAVNPPWDGGFSWTKSKSGLDWVAVSCQGLGASVWWPCKDAQWEEPESGMTMHYVVPKELTCAGNGRLLSTVAIADKNVWTWQVKNPINSYDVTFYIGDYVHWHDTLNGEKGLLDLDFWVLRENESKAREQFKVVKQMIHCFEYWLGPYPFYEDGYKLCDAPYLGMEHQSAIAYGNKYKSGYLGGDRTNTGVGMNFDYIVVHESGHEWFGNSVTARDIADNWIQEGITTYAESLFEECLTNKNNGLVYNRGEWNNIMNMKPMIGDYGVNKEGAPDMYDKGAAMMSMIRTLMDDDNQFRKMLRGLSSTFYHRTVTTADVEDYIIKESGLDLKPFFNQYLRKADIPEIAYYMKDGQLYYHFDNVDESFELPLSVKSGNQEIMLNIKSDWQHVKWHGGYNLHFSKDFLVNVKS